MKKYIQPIINVHAIKPAMLCTGSVRISIFGEDANDEIGAGAKDILIDLDNNIDESL